jgi:NADPH:quinone reductase-like Zn-dependent oxidoreductase
VTDTPATMRAAHVHQLGPAELIRYGELPTPAIGPTDVLVEVETAAVNPVDVFIRAAGGAGAFRTPTPFPFVPGRDLVGTVAATGQGVTGFAPGQRVWCNSLGHGGRQGSFSEYACVPAERLYHLPGGADPVKAVALFHPAVTAELALRVHGGLRAGETVLVAGAAGNVGDAAVRLAAMAGARVLATCRPGDADRCRRAGAAEALDYRDPALGERLRELAPDGIDLYVDTSGKVDLELALEALAFRGRVVLLAGARARPVLPVASLYTRDARVHGFVISRATVDELATAAATINRCLAAGSLHPRVERVLPLERAAEAHRLVEGGLRGRVVVRVRGS